MAKRKRASLEQRLDALEDAILQRKATDAEAERAKQEKKDKAKARADERERLRAERQRLESEVIERKIAAACPEGFIRLVPGNNGSYPDGLWRGASQAEVLRFVSKKYPTHLLVAEPRFRDMRRSYSAEPPKESDIGQESFAHAYYWIVWGKDIGRQVYEPCAACDGTGLHSHATPEEMHERAVISGDLDDDDEDD